MNNKIINGFRYLYLILLNVTLALGVYTVFYLTININLFLKSYVSVTLVIMAYFCCAFIIIVVIGCNYYVKKQGITYLL